MESSLLQELRKFVTMSGWTYAVIWKIGPDHRTPVWHESYFNEFEEREIGQAQQFESVFRRCQFTAARPGYAYLAWMRQSPFWWTRELMEPIPTDEDKELFLEQANIQTLVCFPGREPTNGTGYCIELASTSLVGDDIGASDEGALPGPERAGADDPRTLGSLAHDHAAAEIHKIAERKRRSKMNHKLRTLISVVPIINKKDKVSVLSSTIEYIRQLTSRISRFENREEAAEAPAPAAPATTSRVEEEPTMSTSMERDLEALTPFSNTDAAGAGPSSSGGPIVVVEGSPNGETWLIKVQATNHSLSLIRLLSVFQELGLEVISVDYSTIDGRFRANICIKNSTNLGTSSNELKEALCRVLDNSVETSPSGFNYTNGSQ